VLSASARTRKKPGMNAEDDSIQQAKSDSPGVTSSTEPAVTLPVKPVEQAESGETGVTSPKGPLTPAERKRRQRKRDRQRES
jgi:hypothetical protein